MPKIRDKVVDTVVDIARKTDGLSGGRLQRYKRRQEHDKAKAVFYSYMRARLGHFVSEVDPGPVGTEEIILRTSVLFDEDADRAVDADSYLATGYIQMRNWLKILEDNGFNLRTAQAMFELGCGSARLIRHLRCVHGLRLVASDVESKFIDWCRSNVPGIAFHANDYDPPWRSRTTSPWTP